MKLPLIGTEDYRKAYLLRHGLINLMDELEEADAQWIHTQLGMMVELIDNGDITLDKLRVRLYSVPGGGVGTAVAIYDMLREFKVSHNIDIQTEAYGFCASAGSMIVLQAGDNRLASPNTDFLIHEVRQMSGWESERISDLVDKKEGLDMATKTVYNILSQRTGQSYDEIAQFMDRRDCWMNFDEAMEWGLIDGSI